MSAWKLIQIRRGRQLALLSVFIIALSLLVQSSLCQLSCETSPGVVESFQRDEFCNGVQFCMDGADEGLSDLSVNCDGVDPVYVCLNGASLNIAQLCDRPDAPDCPGNDDEMNPICSAVRIDVTPSNIVNFRDNVAFNCITEDGATFQWQKNGENLPGEIQSTLQVDLVDASDGGQYTCVVSKEGISATLTVTLYIRPYIVANPQPQVLAGLGGSVTFTCEASGFPAPSYRWEKEEDPNLESSEQNLVISPVFFSSGGMYRCVAFSIVEMTNYMVESEAGALIVSPFSGVSISPSSSTSAALGDNVTFSCEAQGGPGNMLAWTKPPSTVILSATASLTVTVEEVEDGGVYECEGTNLAGSGSDTTAINIAPVIVTPPLSLSVSLAGTITLTCVAGGFPPPSITWLRNETEFQGDEDRVTITTVPEGMSSVASTFTITMAMLTDSGGYVCRASSMSGTSIVTALVLVQDTPDQPFNVAAVTITANSVVLEWVEPADNNAPILGYQISYTRPLFLDGLEVIVTSSTEMANITGLHPGVTYTFFVIALNEVGDSEPSDGLTVTTGETAPSRPPQTLLAFVWCFAEIQVIWTEVPEEYRNGIITQYEVMYEALMDYNGIAPTVITTNLSISLADLEEYEEYRVSVRAYTSVGPGPYSVGVTRTTSKYGLKTKHIPHHHDHESSLLSCQSEFNDDLANLVQEVTFLVEDYEQLVAGCKTDAAAVIEPKVYIATLSACAHLSATREQLEEHLCYGVKFPRRFQQKKKKSKTCKITGAGAVVTPF